MNIEHSVANSWWGKTKNDAYKDIVHLNPADATANNRKSNYPLSEVENISWTNGVTTVGTPKSGQGGGAGNVYEPCDEYKGDFARVFMYIFTIYNDISWKTTTTNWMYDTSNPLMFQPWAQTLLLRWHANDPVSDKETSRNDGVYSQQNNRNPYIDLPHLAAHIWGDKNTEPFHVNGGYNPDDPQNPQEDCYAWLNDTDSDAGDWEIENIDLPSGISKVWAWGSTSGKGYLKGSAYAGSAKTAKAYAWSPEISMDNVKKATFSFEHAAKFQTTLRNLCCVSVKDMDNDEITDVAIPSWPSAGNWNFTGSNPIDLSQFANKRIRVGFKYESSDDGADTWEINNAKLMLQRSTSIIFNIEEDDDSFLVEVWGNDIVAPEGARIFDMNGREFDGKNLQRGIYIVVKPSFEKAIKVMVK